MSPFTVAIDGPAASGKGTVARAVAERFGFAHLDTGLLYRAVGARALDGEDPVAVAASLTPQALDNPALRSPDVAQAASKVAALPAVRAALIDFQRAFARRAGGAVLDGRDIGTVICPQAEVKVFVTANATTRAKRRFRELVSQGHDLTFEEVLADIQARDKRDASRRDAPLAAAEDAIHLDTTELRIDEAVRAVADAISTRLDERSGE